MAWHEFRKRQIEQFDNLDSVHQAMVFFASLCCCRIPKTYFVNCVNATGLRTSRGIQFYLDSIEPILASLAEAEFIDYNDDGIAAHPSFGARAVQLASQRQILKALIESLEMARLSKRGLGVGYNHPQTVTVRKAWWSLWQGDVDFFRTQILEIIKKEPYPSMKNSYLFLWFGHPSHLDIILEFEPPLRQIILREVITIADCELEPAHDAFQFFEKNCDLTNDLELSCLCRGLLLRGSLQRAEHILKDLEGPIAQQYLGILLFLRRDFDGALNQFRKLKRTQFEFKTIFPVLYFLGALHMEGSQQSMSEIRLMLRQLPGHMPWVLIRCLFDRPKRKIMDELKKRSPEDFCGRWLACLIGIRHFPEPVSPPIFQWLDKAQMSGLSLLAGEIIHVLNQWDQLYKTHFEVTQIEEIQQVDQNEDVHFYAGSLFLKQDEWSRVLRRLIQFKPQPLAAADQILEKDTRLIWLCNISMGRLYCSPAEQRRKDRDGWTTGRKISLKRLHKNYDAMPWLTSQDRELCAAIAPESTPMGPRYFIEEDCAARILQNHPYLFRKDAPEAPVVLSKGKPELRILREGDSLNVTLHPSRHFKEKKYIVFEKEPDYFSVVEINSDTRAIYDILDKQICIPVSELDLVKQAVSNISTWVEVQSEAPIFDAKELGSASLHLRLQSCGEGLKVEMRVQPHGAGGPYFKPGHGAKHAVAHINGEPVSASRSLSEETDLAARELAELPVLYENDLGSWDWNIEDRQTCLALLESVQARQPGLFVSWVGTNPFKADFVSKNDLQLKLKKVKDWFQMRGLVTLTDDRIIELQKVMTIITQSPGRFLLMEDDHFLGLSEELYGILKKLGFACTLRGNTVQLPPALALVMGHELEKLPGLKVDGQWKELIEASRNNPYENQLQPSSLMVDLRDYQLAGYKWLLRLASWGFGACLADDMGLGKTLQVLACLIDRAKDGPALVVAPTSVCFNWLEETLQFAPLLKPVLFGNCSSRSQAIEELEPFHLIICSYGLLLQEGELLNQVPWNTIVLDEAQIIKNPSSKTSKAAKRLSGKFKVITSGTPIENNLSELWSLMDFLNPGLLGPLSQFKKRFSNPIENNRDPEARRILKQILRPFILRRRKSEVLEELPPKSEINIHVEHGEEEKALYELLRQSALSFLTENDGGTPGAPAVLAQLMKLRRVCCHPKLIDPQSAISSSKLAALDEILEGLLANHHKTLIFSQFVDHLQILRNHLIEKGVSFQYLDGSTPTKERRRAIQAFQNGEGDVFLISLKAGGLGLNLTQADFVLHMDPWWNPAVEDQASDRAHRLGQKRNVTVYRFITKGTIEEKIVALHREKRELADSLLEGGEKVAQLTTAELLALIQNG